MDFFGFIKMVIWLSLLLAISVVIIGVNVQASTEGYISIDCGSGSNQTYNDLTTGILYTSDDQYIDTGTNYKISPAYRTNSLPVQELTVRSFPTGKRNCYNLTPAAQYQKYLIRAYFMYGNYDGQNNASSSNPIQFDLHIGTNLWKTISIYNASSITNAEALTLATANYISVCLINKGSGTPFISALELRPLDQVLYDYVNITQSLDVFLRWNMGSATNEVVRYPTDPYDRIWSPSTSPNWTTLSTTSPITHYSSDQFLVPQPVLQTASMPLNSNTTLQLQWPDPAKGSGKYYINFHLTELRNLSATNDSRFFDINLDGGLWFGEYSPPFLFADFIYTTSPYTGYADYVFDFTALANSTLPPLVNAVEVYLPVPVVEGLTNATDVEAVMAIRGEYQLKRNWVGDPCLPVEYVWEGLNCSSGVAPRIVLLNLDGSGLTGAISPSISVLGDLEYLNLSSNYLIGTIPDSLGSLSSLQVLDLSYNNLTGIIPDSLGNLLSLEVLNISGNNFSGSIPDSLLKRSEDGSLILRYDNGSTTAVATDSNSNRKISTPVIIAIVVGVVLLLIMVFFILFLLLAIRRRKDVAANTSVRQETGNDLGQRVVLTDLPATDSQQFTYNQVVSITNNFSRIIKKGQYGTIYHGYLGNGDQVTVKLYPQSSPGGAEEFVLKARNLARIHHRNLVSLVGYCKEGNLLAVIYEYMSQGNLHDCLRGLNSIHGILTWEERLHIALEAAQGLDYLHTGCEPPIIHKDVKTSNILLGDNLEAKLTNFGLSKSFHSADESHLVMVGTPGYLAPEFQNSYELNGQTDVYSFGVVLLEMITGQPPPKSRARKGDLVQHASSYISEGKLDDIIDQRLQGAYDSNSTWKVADLALSCTSKDASKRPKMVDVVMQLKESIALETARNNFVSSGDQSSSQISMFELARQMPHIDGPVAR